MERDRGGRGWGGIGDGKDKGMGWTRAEGETTGEGRDI